MNLSGFLFLASLAASWALFMAPLVAIWEWAL